MKTHSAGKPVTPGFTLIEAIVVAAIVAVLAAIAIPVYLGFQVDARHTAVDQLAQTAAAAADGFYRKTGNIPVVSDLSLFYDANKYNVTVSDPNVQVYMIGHTDYTKNVPFKQ